MKKTTTLFAVLIMVISIQCSSERGKLASESVELQYLNEKLTEIADTTSNELFALHLASIQKVIIDKKYITEQDSALLVGLYDAFESDTLAPSSDFQSYVNRQRMLILAYESPTDGEVSFAWLKLPKDWSPDEEYPLYVQLHGYWDVADNPLHFMSFTFLEGPMTTFAFEDGYFLAPWGRGNKWYHGAAKADVWESIAELESVLKVNQNRKYLTGHSMGGYGTWHIAQESAETWAGLGLHSAALHYKRAKYITPEYAEKLKDTPIYFYWGKEEDQLKIKNIEANELLIAAGNQNTFTTEFEGGHDYNESDVEAMYVWLRQFSKN